MVPYPIKESFNWMTPEFKVAKSAGRNTIRIRGIAMRSDAISRNNRKYIDEELVKAARTFYEKPVTINHDMTKKVGTVKWMEYENGCMEYIADINKQPYVDLLRNKSADIKGVSIEALYLHNMCPICGERFYTEQDYHTHMRDIEYVKNYETTEPHGIVGQALSLVLTPEEPGYTGTTIELMETSQRLSQLLEMVIKTEKEKETMAKQTKKTKVPYRIREQTEKPEDEDEDKKKKPEDVEEQEDHGCKEGEEWDGEKCVPKATEQVAVNTGEDAEGDTEPLACPTGYHLVTDDAGNQSCEPDLPPPPMDNTTATEALDVQPMEMPVAGDGATVTPSEPELSCPVGQHRDPATNLCIADDSVVEPAPNTMETVKLPTLLRLGEPFAGYSSMDDCIAKNPDKDDPAAYCASIMQKAEGEPASEVKETKDIYETQQNIRRRLAEINNVGVVRDARIAEKVNSLNRSMAGVAKQVQSINTASTKQLKEVADKLQKHVKNVEKAVSFNIVAESRKQRRATAKELNRLVKQANTIVEAFNKHVTYTRQQLSELSKPYNKLQEYVTGELGKLSTAIATADKQTKQQLSTLQQSITETSKRILPPDPKLLQEITALKELVKHVEEVATEQKTDFEKILQVANDNYTNVKEQLKSLEAWKQEKEKELAETDKHAKEASALKEALEPLTNKIDNLESKLKGEFKQKNKEIKPEDPPETDLKQDKLPYD